MIVRQGQLIPLGPCVSPRENEVPQKVLCRFRTLGCYPCTGAVRSEARSVNEIMNERCDLCDRDALVSAYRPPTTGRGLTVHVCGDCGLVQSLPRIDHVEGQVASTTSGAGWGNVRYGKGFRSDDAIRLLSRHLTWQSLSSVLDVGSSRGSFVLKLSELAPRSSIVAVEPDRRIIDEYRNRAGIRVVSDRIERIRLPDEQFDLVYCSHTLEHLASARGVLMQIRASMKPDGLLYVEVPNLRLGERDDLFEEFFIDKHLYHYGHETLLGLLSRAGFELKTDVMEVADENLVAIASPGRVGRQECALAKPSDVLSMLKQYAIRLEANLGRLREAARAIAELSRSHRVVIWGAGRIFDSLVTHGGLDPTLLAGVIDKHLSAYVSSVHGVQVHSPNRFDDLAPDLVVIASRVFHDEIRAEVVGRRPDCRTVRFNALSDGVESGIPSTGKVTE